MTEIKTIQNNIHTSPRKLRLVADMVRKMTPSQAIKTLEFTNKAAAKPLAAAIKTVLANARQKSLDETRMSFKKLEINEGGMKLVRVRPQARGRRNPYTKRTSQIKIVLSDEGGEKYGSKN